MNLEEVLKMRFKSREEMVEVLYDFTWPNNHRLIQELEKKEISVLDAKKIIREALEMEIGIYKKETHSDGITYFIDENGFTYHDIESCINCMHLDAYYSRLYLLKGLEND